MAELEHTLRGYRSPRSVGEMVRKALGDLKTVPAMLCMFADVTEIDLRCGGWVVQASTPFTPDDRDSLPDYQPTGGYYAIACWLVEQNIPAGLRQSTLRRTRGDWGRRQSYGYLDIYFTSDTHRVFFDLTWRGRMRSVRRTVL